MAGKLDGRVTLVTGAGSGLGLASARRLAAEGAVVACLDRDGEAAERAAESCAGGAIALVADITDSAAMEAAVERVEADLGALEIVLANAGIQGEGSAHELSPERWGRVIGVNLTGQFLTVRAALGPMVERRRGSIVLTASIAGLAGQPGLAAYAAAKGGVIALTRQLAIDYGRYGIRVNCICPGTVLTPLVRSAYEARGGGIDEQIASRSAQVPLGRLGETEDVANLVLFLVGDESGWITGQASVVDGGITASMFPGEPPAEPSRPSADAD
ncbi:MAG TPA: SDR family NAD(P)-dependent oxidoreductase [Solirubrobacterales bacterium]|nr:SDR family NAD(P)-dependent oxidoreductase [Solirubrobacterales bacterium]